jgi:hypothetical protein
MHTTRTFILRLLVDSEDARGLRGALRSVAEDEEHPFSDQESLVALLQGMARASGDRGVKALAQPRRAARPEAE